MQISIFIAFGYGLLSFFSPCILPLLPVFVANLTNPEIFDNRVKQNRFSIFFHSLSFVIGFSVVFTLWGAGAGLIGVAFSRYLAVVRQISGVLITIFGLLMLASLVVPRLNYEKRLNLSGLKAGSYLRSFLIGAVFPVAWIPCTSWVLGGILLMAGTSQTAWQGAYLLAVYSLGLGLPFLVLGIAFDFIVPLLKNISKYTKWVYVFSGLLLIAVGILILMDKMLWFQSLI
ncbi:MAG: cytochrome c biogenesis protein CcdA [Dehalococcoidales bacterium]|nr:cytochrome c biogenesis protein CcdA [Dehalococcoidales bacterium]